MASGRASNGDLVGGIGAPSGGGGHPATAGAPGPVSWVRHRSAATTTADEHQCRAAALVRPERFMRHCLPLARTAPDDLRAENGSESAAIPDAISRDLNAATHRGP